LSGGGLIFLLFFTLSSFLFEDAGLVGCLWIGFDWALRIVFVLFLVGCGVGFGGWLFCVLGVFFLLVVVGCFGGITL